MPKPKKNVKTDERLMRSATKLFASYGYDAVSVKQIADSANVNVGLISYHFGGKLSLYRRCIEQFGKERLEAVQRILVSPQTREELEIRLSMFIEEFIQYHLDTPDVCAIIHREMDMQRSELDDIFQGTFLKVFHTLVNFLKDGKKRKLIRAEIDPLIASTIFFSVISQATRMDPAHERHLKVSIKKKVYKNKLVSQATNILLTGVLIHS